MLSEAVAFWDMGALAIVLAGTSLATAARCGLRDLRGALREVLRLTSSDFDKSANRAALARCTPEIKRRGHLCAEATLPPDRSIAELVQAYLINGSFDDLQTTARVQRTSREITGAQAMRVFDYAGEQAPIFGLVGTLFALTQISPAADGETTEAMMGAVGTAVLSTLYGVLTAHLFCVPLAGAIERRGLREEAARAELIEWFEAELRGRHAKGRRAAAPIRLQDVA